MTNSQSSFFALTWISGTKVPSLETNNRSANKVASSLWQRVVRFWAAGFGTVSVFCKATVALQCLFWRRSSGFQLRISSRVKNGALRSSECPNKDRRSATYSRASSLETRGDVSASGPSNTSHDQKDKEAVWLKAHAYLTSGTKKGCVTLSTNR